MNQYWSVTRYVNGDINDRGSQYLDTCLKYSTVQCHGVAENNQPFRCHLPKLRCFGDCCMLGYLAIDIVERIKLISQTYETYRH